MCAVGYLLAFNLELSFLFLLQDSYCALCRSQWPSRPLLPEVLKSPGNCIASYSLDRPFNTSNRARDLW
jgi:hypothetical protein